MIITNAHDLSVNQLIERYAWRMTIEQRLAEIIQASIFRARARL